MQFIDLRSDTVTHPTPEMRAAISSAQVGDDVYGEDPTVNRLEALSAEMLGKEAGMFVPSGTMGNLSAILAHCQRGDEVILGNLSHTFLYEAGGISALGGVHSRQLNNQPDGSLDMEDIRAAVRPDDAHHPITRLISLENTHNRCGGTYQTVEYTRSVHEFAKERGLSVHLDGARLFNATVAMGIQPAELAAHVDSLTFCLSKALCAPVGSVLVGPSKFIAKARRIRKQLGGGMRQAGILAAAGIVALETMIDRLSEDHSKARRLADGLRQIPAVVLDPGTPATNMVFLNLAEQVPLSARDVAEELKKAGVLVGVTGARRFRLVTHHGVDGEAIDTAVMKFKGVLA